MWNLGRAFGIGLVWCRIGGPSDSSPLWSFNPLPGPMRLLRPSMLLLPFALGCAEVERSIEETVPADGIDRLEASVERGSLTYAGISETTFLIEGTSIGRGGGEQGAERREEGNEVTVEVADATLHLDATSEFKRARVDLDVSGPSVLDLDVYAERGSVHMEEVEGEHIITADRVTSRQLIGNCDLLARSGGMDVDIWPYLEGRVILESTAGDVVLRLPYSGQYDIEVIADPAYEMYIEDLGFHSDFFEPGYFAGVVGDGSIEVTVYVNGGSFQLLESL